MGECSVRPSAELMAPVPGRQSARIRFAGVADGIPYQLPVTVAACRFGPSGPRSFDIIDE
jgi:hypothetical protein